MKAPCLVDHPNAPATFIVFRVLRSRPLRQTAPFSAADNSPAFHTHMLFGCQGAKSSQDELLPHSRRAADVQQLVQTGPQYQKTLLYRKFICCFGRKSNNKSHENFWQLNKGMFSLCHGSDKNFALQLLPCSLPRTC